MKTKTILSLSIIFLFLLTASNSVLAQNKTNDVLTYNYKYFFYNMQEDWDSKGNFRLTYSFHYFVLKSGDEIVYKEFRFGHGGIIRNPSLIKSQRPFVLELEYNWSPS